MTNYEFYQQLAIDIAEDGFALHAKVATNFISLLHREQRFSQSNASILVEAVGDTSLSPIGRARAYGQLRPTTVAGPVAIPSLTTPTAPFAGV